MRQKQDGTPVIGACLLSDFEGTWLLERVIQPEGGTDMRFEGQAVWTRQGVDLAYREDGWLYIAGQPTMQAERRYLWTRGLDVYFDDGRYFHTVATDGSEIHHWCDPDTYKGQYDFTDWPEFSVTWNVTGPRKAYTSRSLYRRR